MEHDDVSRLGFLQGGGAMGALKRAHYWTASPLGDPNSWLQPLRCAVGLVLQSSFPMFVAWGENLLLLYNDAYIEILGSKHPRALGSPFYDIWPEFGPENSQAMAAGLAGKATHGKDVPVVVNRK